MKKYIIENWELFAEANNLYGVEVYKPKYLGDEVLTGIVAYLEFLLNAQSNELQLDDDHLVLKKVMLLVADYIHGFDPYCQKSAHRFRNQVKSMLSKYLLSCRLELNQRQEKNEELLIRIVE